MHNELYMSCAEARSSAQADGQIGKINRMRRMRTDIFAENILRDNDDAHAS